MTAASPHPADLKPVLAVDELEISYQVGTGHLTAVRGVSFEIGRGESFGLVGESGCGKSTVAMAIMRYLPRNGRISGGSIRVAGQDVTSLSASELRKLRTGRISMVYQDPGTALNPSMRVGRQVAEVFELMGVGRSHTADRVAEILGRVQISDPVRVMRRYPHQLSGGMLQRVVIAMAIASNPDLLVLDEPTTGLDATVEAEVLDLVSALRRDTGTTVLFISHSLAVIRKMCDRVGVLYAGRLVEEGPAEELFQDPRHPYTVGLLRCLPQGEARRDRGTLDTIPGFLPPLGAHILGCVFADRCAMVQNICREEEPPLNQAGPDRVSRCHFHADAPNLPHNAPVVPPVRAVASHPILQITATSKTFQQDGQAVRALSGIDLAIHQGETVALVGESGSGKSTLARVILGIYPPDAGGSIDLDGVPLAGPLGGRSAEQIRSMQIVFQNPDSALNRRHSVRRIVGRAVQRLLGTRDPEARVKELLSSVRVGEHLLTARPRHLSGGLKQRVAIARAFAGTPELVVCDEPTSALDVSVQAAIINLLVGLQAERGVSYLFITHDLGVVRYLADRVAVMYLGKLMEVGPADRIFSGPHHPYTEALLSAAPELESTGRIRLVGEIPSAADPPPGCPFQTRCHRKIGEICETVEPQLEEVEPGYFKRCHIPVAELARLEAVPVG